MEDKFDINAVAAAFIQQNIDSFMDTGKGILKATTDKVRLHLDRTYTNYLKCMLDKYSKAKSFFIRTEPIYLYEFYVPLSLRCRKEIIDRPQFTDIVNFSRCSVITGSGGSGKSMLMRHLLLNSIMAKSKVPILIELRQFNENGRSLMELIQNNLKINKFQLDIDFIRKALENGHFVIFLDGFDEIIQEKRQTVTKFILELAKEYDRNCIVVSSRPDTELEGWPGFGILHVQSLTLEQAHSLVTLLPYDEDLKKKFADDLRTGLFKKHQSFLSNPLLLSIMLLTYGQSANIPNKLNVFYNQAYEALFERHDALKSGYHRQRSTKLDIQDFARVFSAFCIQTYDMRKFEFSHIEALEYIDKSKQITRLDYNKDNYLKDALQAVCLLVEEGLTIVFSHRSFQEYFTARFIAEAPFDIQKQLVQKYSRNVSRDNVMTLIYEMRPELVEQFYIIPELDNLFKSIGVRRVIGLTHYTRYLKLAYRGFAISEENIRGSGSAKYGFSISDLVSFTLRVCGNFVNWFGFDHDSKSIAQLKSFHDKYGEKDRIFKLSTANLAPNNSIVRDFAEISMFFSIETLKMVNRIREILKEKIRLSEKSLDDILKR